MNFVVLFFFTCVCSALSLPTKVLEESVTNEQAITRNQGDEIKNQSSIIKGLEKKLTDPCEFPVVYPNDPKKMAKTCYHFDGGKTTLKFVGYGYDGRHGAYEYKHGIDFDQCITWCKHKRDMTTNWDSLEYHLKGRTCFCVMKGKGFRPNNEWICYHF